MATKSCSLTIKNYPATLYQNLSSSAVCNLNTVIILLECRSFAKFNFSHDFDIKK